VIRLDLTEAVEAGRKGAPWVHEVDVAAILGAATSVMRGLLAEDDAKADRRRFRRLAMRIEDLEHELKLARQHLDVCPRWQAVADHDRDKARSNQ